MYYRKGMYWIWLVSYVDMFPKSKFYAGKLHSHFILQKPISIITNWLILFKKNKKIKIHLQPKTASFPCPWEMLDMKAVLNKQRQFDVK